MAGAPLPTLHAAEVAAKATNLRNVRRAITLAASLRRKEGGAFSSAAFCGKGQLRDRFVRAKSSGVTASRLLSVACDSAVRAGGGTPKVIKPIRSRQQTL